MRALLLRQNTTEDFLLTNAVNGTNINKAGTCPHGVAPGACPICSNMGGGGMRPGERVQKPGEMSYHECAMIGAMMRAREAQQKLHEENLLRQAEALKSFEQNLVNVAQKMAEFASNIQKFLPLKPVSMVINNIVVPVIKSIANLPNIISNIAEKITQLKEKFIDIMDKLTAVFGEAKAFIEKKVSEFVSMVKTRFESLFKIFKRNNTKDDETKIDEDKKIFRLKTFISKILGRKKDDSEDKSRS